MLTFWPQRKDRHRKITYQHRPGDKNPYLRRPSARAECVSTAERTRNKTLARDRGSQEAGWSRGRGRGPWTRVWWSGSEQRPKPRGPRRAPRTQGANPGKSRVLGPIHLQGLPGQASVSPAFELSILVPSPCNELHLTAPNLGSRRGPRFRAESPCRV